MIEQFKNISENWGENKSLILNICVHMENVHFCHEHL